MELRDIRFGVSICVHNERDYITYCLKSIYDFAHVIAISVNVGIPWGGKTEPLDDTLDIIRAFPDPDSKIRLVTGEWSDEMGQRTYTADILRPEANYLMTVDADEVYDAKDLENLRKYVALRPLIGQFRMRMRTYWKIHPFYVIDPPEPYRRYLISRLRPSTRLVGFSKTNERFCCTIPEKVAVFHHFSYARTDERIRQKLINSSHAAEFVTNWYERVWQQWDVEPTMQNLHPTHPQEYKRAISVDINRLPEVMRTHPYAYPK